MKRWIIHPGVERDSYVESACGGDLKLAASILGMLDTDHEAALLFEESSETLAQLLSSEPIVTDDAFANSCNWHNH